MPLQYLSEGKSDSSIVNPGSQVKVKAGKKAVIRPSLEYESAVALKRIPRIARQIAT